MTYFWLIFDEKVNDTNSTSSERFPISRYLEEKSVTNLSNRLLKLVLCFVFFQ